MNIKHVPMISDIELAEELNLTTGDFAFGYSDSGYAIYFETTLEEIKKLEEEIKIIEERGDNNSMLYNPEWIPLYKNTITAIELLREKYGIVTGVYVRIS